MRKSSYYIFLFLTPVQRFAYNIIKSLYLKYDKMIRLYFVFEDNLFCLKRFCFFSRIYVNFENVYAMDFE